MKTRTDPSVWKIEILVDTSLADTVTLTLTVAHKNSVNTFFLQIFSIISYNVYFLDYVAGNLNGRSVGYQARSSLLPVTSSDTSFPVVRSVASNPLFNAFNTQNIVRSVETPQVVASTPAITSSVLRTVDPSPVTLVSSAAQPAVRFVNDQSAFSLASNPGVRFVNEQPAVSLVSNPSVRFVNEQPAVSLVSNPSVRFVNEQPAVSFISNPLATAQQQFQVLERFTLPQQIQQIQQQAQPFIIQNGRSVFGSPTLSRFVDQPFVVSRTQPVGSYGSTGLRNLVLGNNDFRFVDNAAY
jgi:hypothetical protein